LLIDRKEFIHVKGLDAAEMEKIIITKHLEDLSYAMIVRLHTPQQIIFGHIKNAKSVGT